MVRFFGRAGDPEFYRVKMDLALFDEIHPLSRGRDSSLPEIFPRVFASAARLMIS